MLDFPLSWVYCLASHSVDTKHTSGEAKEGG